MKNLDLDQRIRATLKKRTHDFRAFRSSVYEASADPDLSGWGGLVHSGSDFTAVPDVYPRHGDRWGSWRFDARRLVLEYESADWHPSYEIPLESCTTSEEMLGWIFHTTSKSRGWVSATDLADMLEALNDLLRPEANLYSFGKNKQIPDVASLIRSRMKESRASIRRKLASQSSTSQSSLSRELSTAESTVEARNPNQENSNEQLAKQLIN